MVIPPEPPEPPAPPVMTDPGGRVLRGGWCEAIHGVSLPWARFKKGCRYRFEECDEVRGRRYFRVYAGLTYAVVGPGRFGSHFVTEESQS